MQVGMNSYTRKRRKMGRFSSVQYQKRRPSMTSPYSFEQPVSQFASLLSPTHQSPPPAVDAQLEQAHLFGPTLDQISISPPTRPAPAVSAQHVSQALQEQNIVPPENHTGLPDALKAGVECLSGFSLDDVRVHYNSSEPARVLALAYTQGTDIYVGPGQEQYLAHEAWHVVQQMQGRVEPTLQMKGMAINNDEKLEQEADVVGNMTLQVSGSLELEREQSMVHSHPQQTPSPGSANAPAQMKVRINDTVFSTMREVMKDARALKTFIKLSPLQRRGFKHVMADNNKTYDLVEDILAMDRPIEAAQDQMAQIEELVQEELAWEEQIDEGQIDEGQIDEGQVDEEQIDVRQLAELMKEGRIDVRQLAELFEEGRIERTQIDELVDEGLIKWKQIRQAQSQIKRASMESAPMEAAPIEAAPMESASGVPSWMRTHSMSTAGRRGASASASASAAAVAADPSDPREDMIAHVADLHSEPWSRGGPYQRQTLSEQRNNEGGFGMLYRWGNRDWDLHVHYDKNGKIKSQFVKLVKTKELIRKEKTSTGPKKAPELFLTPNQVDAIRHRIKI
jgi:uncharacterized protein DUF4157